MAYQALYRKWRPLTFDDVRGQNASAGTLKNQILTDRIGHAYLFCGTRGCGKTSVAKIMARAVNCPDAAENGGNPCNKCAICRSIMEGSSMNVFEIDAASNNGVDNIRDIREQVEYPPTEGRFKVYIIDEVHMLSTGAFNALLKTLEEPPAYVIFILATTDPQKVPQTILSRCQRYDFRRMGKATICEYINTILLSEGLKAEDKAIDYIANAADGSMRDSLSILERCLSFVNGETLTYEKVLDVLGAADMSVFSEIFRGVCRRDTLNVLSVLDRAVMEGKEPSLFVNDLIWYLRNVLLLSAAGDSVLEVTEDSLARIREDSGLITRGRLISMITSLSDLSNRMRQASQKRVLLEVELIKLCQGGASDEPAGDVRRPAVYSNPGPKPAPSADGAPWKEEHKPAAVPVPEVKPVINAEPETGEEVKKEAAPEVRAETAAIPDGISKLQFVSDNWDRLLSGLSPSNRVLFAGTVLKEENGKVVIVFKNKINYTLAAKSRENGLLQLSGLLRQMYGMNVHFLARTAEKNEFPEDQGLITDEDLKKINFHVDIE